MLKPYRLSIAAITVILSILCTVASPDYNRHHTADSLSQRLKTAATAADSIRLLSNLYDVYRLPEHKDSAASELVRLAIRTADSTYGLDILRNRANLHLKNDTLLQADLANAMMFPESEDRAETITFIEMMRNLHRVRYAAPDEIESEIHKLLRKINATTDNSPIYDQIVDLHALCLFVGECSQGEMLSKYLDRLSEKIDQLRPEAYAIRNAYYVQAALSYTANDEHAKAVEADRKLLASIDRLEKGEEGMNRPFRDYDGNRYIVYTRLLANYEHLTPKEVEHFYDEVMKLIDSDAQSKATNRLSGRPQIYYALYKKDYPKALELLKTYADMPYNHLMRKQMLRETIRCAEAVGDSATLLKASRQYNTVLEESFEQRSQEKYKELQIAYEVHQLKASHAMESFRMHRLMLNWAIVIAVILLIALIVIILMWRHSRKLAKNLQSANDALVKESDNLKLIRKDLVEACEEARSASKLKSDFIRSMSSEIAVPIHTINEYTNLIMDCSDAGFKPYLKSFADLITLNSEMLSTIVNDMLSLSEIDSKAITIHKKKDQLQHLLTAAVTSVKHRVAEGVTMNVDTNERDITIETDPRRFLQVMVQLLSNAAKFTSKGSIDITYDIDEENSMVNIYVTDSGTGISPSNSERIFERFVKLDSNSQGVGNGLPLARHLAELLDGSLMLDTSYTGQGARFIFSIPL